MSGWVSERRSWCESEEVGERVEECVWEREVIKWESAEVGKSVREERGGWMKECESERGKGWVSERWKRRVSERGKGLVSERVKEYESNRGKVGWMREWESVFVYSLRLSVSVCWCVSLSLCISMFT